MIHGLLCTLMMGTVLPEPEPPKYYLVLQVVSWQLADREDHALEPPVTAKVIGELNLPAANCFRRTLKTSPFPSRLNPVVRSNSVLFPANSRGGFADVPASGITSCWTSTPRSPGRLSSVSAESTGGILSATNASS